jgi:hypothetical protein
MGPTGLKDHLANGIRKWRALPSELHDAVVPPDPAAGLWRSPSPNIWKEHNMSLIQCIYCHTEIPEQEALAVWCETCGKKIPPYLVAQVRKAQEDARRKGLPEPIDRALRG